jgi:hypothetical protein
MVVTFVFLGGISVGVALSLVATAVLVANSYHIKARQGGGRE